MKKPLGIVGVPSELGANRPGTAKAPRIIMDYALPRLKHAVNLGCVKVPKHPRGRPIENLAARH